MDSRQKTLLIINLLGGIAVIGSYAYGLSSQGSAEALWGGVSPGVRPLYIVSMVISALAYFAFTYYVLFKLEPEEVRIGRNTGFGIFYWIYAAILVPSSLWMPLTAIYINEAADIIWVGVRGVLFVVGLASVALVFTLVRMKGLSRGLSYSLAVAGSIYFAFHTAVLDAIVWVIMFR